MSLDWHLGSALLSEYDGDGFLGLQIDALGGKSSGMGTMEALHPHGFFSVPRDPDEGGQCTTLYFYQGNQAFALAMEDPRPVNAGQLPVRPPKGSSVQYGHRAGTLRSYDYHDGETGTKTILVDYPGGTHVIKVHGDADYIEINGAKVTSNGNVITASGVDLDNLIIPSPFGPLGPPTAPTPGV